MGAAWTPQEAGVHQICYLLAEVQKPGTNQGQVCRERRQALAGVGSLTQLQSNARRAYEHQLLELGACRACMPLRSIGDGLTSIRRRY